MAWPRCMRWRPAAAFWRRLALVAVALQLACWEPRGAWAEPVMEPDGQPDGRVVRESDVFLGGKPFSANETDNLGIIYRWLDDLMWTEMWDDSENRRTAYNQVKQLADLSATHLPSMAYAVGQCLYSYFWFKDNGGSMNMDAVQESIRLHEVSLDYSGCRDLSMGVGAFIGKACAERWMYLIMILAEAGTELAGRRTDMGKAAKWLQHSEDLFQTVNTYDYFSFRGWKSIYDMNTNSHVFAGNIRQRPVWPTKHIPVAQWLEDNFQVFRDDLDYIVKNDLFDTLYFSGHVSMTQFSGKRESWAPLNIVHNRKFADHVCKVANRTCELLATRPEIVNCHAQDVGAAFARLVPGMGIKPHFWSAPPRLGLHLGLRTPPGAEMTVGDQVVRWQEGKAVVFDDTFIHTVWHNGEEARYLLIAWFCHPCDDMHAEVPQQYPPGICTSDIE